MMSSPAIDIPNLLFSYAQYIDAGDFDSASELFSHAQVEAGENVYTGGAGLTDLWKSWIRLYNGKPLTRHLITNPIITLSGNGKSAECLSQWTVLQAAQGLPLQVIGSGSYQDKFQLTIKGWRFSFRKYAGIELAGNMSAHLKRRAYEEDNDKIM